MNGIRIHLDAAEQDAVQRHAEALGVDSEDIAYTALNRLLLELKRNEKEIDQEIVNVRDCRHRSPPMGMEFGANRHREHSEDEVTVVSGWFR